MRFFGLLITFFIIGILSGCAMNNSIPLPHNYWQQKQTKIAVARLVFDKPALYQEGQEGFADVLINTIVTNEFAEQLAKFDMQWYPQLQNTIYKKFVSKHMNVILISQPINASHLDIINKDHAMFADKNFAELRAQLKSDQLLLIRVNAIGARRRYYGFIPISKPEAICNVQGDLIDLKTNRIIWRGHGMTVIRINDKWDQPPLYSNFMQALKSSVQSSSQQLLNTLFTN